MKKIAVCLPTYNECENIKRMVKRVDKALRKYFKESDCYIVNCDNNSKDDTNAIFNKVKTYSEKISIMTNDIGKGINIYNFIEFCYKKNIDIAFMFDSDLVSFNKKWIKKMLKKIKKCDMVLPIYERKRDEGNVTNHFVLPVLRRKYGIDFRQPIGGDYAFNKQTIENLYINSKMILENSFIKGYGIDIFLVLTTVYANKKILEVNLGKKVHADSKNKMKKIFEEVYKTMEYMNKDESIKTKYDLNKNYTENEKNNYKKTEYQIWDKLINDFIQKKIDKNYSIEEVYRKFYQYIKYFYQFTKDMKKEEWNIIIKKFAKGENIYDNNK